MVDSGIKSVFLETVKHQIKSDKIKVVDKFVIQEKPHYLTKDEDEWLKEESSQIVTFTVENDEDVSFSNHEKDDDDGNIPINYKKATYRYDFSRNESVIQVEFDRSSTDK